MSLNADECNKKCFFDGDKISLCDNCIDDPNNEDSYKFYTLSKSECNIEGFFDSMVDECLSKNGR